MLPHIQSRPTRNLSALGEWVLLGAIWGMSFQFMRVASPEFGPVLLIAVRVVVASALLLPLMAWRTSRTSLTLLREHWGPIAFVGLFNSAIPFCLFAYATLSLPASYAAVINATAAIWTALLGKCIWKQQLSTWQWLGLALGFVGVVVLMIPKRVDTLDAKFPEFFLAVGACLLATLCYGVSANFTKHRLREVSPLAIATYSQCAASAALIPLSLMHLPQKVPSILAISNALALGVLCTAVAYVLYFRLIANLGTAKAMTVTLLVPVFGVIFGVLFLGETMGLNLLIGGAFVVIGTAMTMGRLSMTHFRAG
jgi:drug/metabolite transporter (DMT)-like permease